MGWIYLLFMLLFLVLFCLGLIYLTYSVRINSEMKGSHLGTTTDYQSVWNISVSDFQKGFFCYKCKGILQGKRPNYNTTIYIQNGFNRFAGVILKTKLYENRNIEFNLFSTTKLQSDVSYEISNKRLAVAIIKEKEYSIDEISFPFTVKRSKRGLFATIILLTQGSIMSVMAVLALGSDQLTILENALLGLIGFAFLCLGIYSLKGIVFGNVEILNRNTIRIHKKSYPMEEIHFLVVRDEEHKNATKIELRDNNQKLLVSIPSNSTGFYQLKSFLVYWDDIKWYRRNYKLLTSNNYRIEEKDITIYAYQSNDEHSFSFDEVLSASGNMNRYPQICFVFEEERNIWLNVERYNAMTRALKEL